VVRDPRARDYSRRRKVGGATVSVEDAKTRCAAWYRLSLASLEQDHGQGIVRHGCAASDQDGMADGDLGSGRRHRGRRLLAACQATRGCSNTAGWDPLASKDTGYRERRG